MQTLFQMSEAELLAWAIEFRNTSVETTIAKTLTLSAKRGDYPAVSIDKFDTYGFQRFHNDLGLGADTPVADKQKAGKLKFEQAKLGVVGRTRGEAVDPFMVIVMRVVRAAVKKKNADNYKRIMAKAPAARDAEFKAIFEKQRVGNTDKYQAIMAKATLLRKQQEEAAKLTVDGMDADDL